MLTIAPSLTLVTVLLCLQQQTPPTPEKPACKITVVDPTEAPIAKAQVLVHKNSDSDPHADRALRTDGNGQVAEQLQPGLYDVCVMAPVFAPACKQIRVQNHELQLRFRLSISRLVEMVE